MFSKSKTTEQNKKHTHKKKTLQHIVQELFFFINLFIFIYFWLRWVFVAARRLSDRKSVV